MNVRAVVVVLCFAALAFGPGCAYFNTFYHAREHFDEAEKARLETSGAPHSSAGRPGEAAGEAGPRISKRALDLYEKCMKKCAKILTDYQDSRWVDDALLMMGKCAIARGEYATGLRKYEELLEFYPNSELVPDARLQIGVAHLEEGTPASAIPALEAAAADTKRKDLALDAHYYLGRARLAAGDSAAAAAELDLFVAGAYKHPLRKTAIHTLGAIELARGNPAKAREVYERLKTSPRADWKGYREVRLAVAECLREEGRLDESREVYESLIARATDVRDSAEISLNLALIVQEAGDDSSTVAAFEELALRFPRTEAAARAQYEKGVIFYDRDADLERARGALDSVSVHSGQIPQGPRAKERARVLAKRLALDDRLATRLQRVAAAAQEPELVPEPETPVTPADSAGAVLVPADSALATAGALGADSLRANGASSDSLREAAHPDSAVAPVANRADAPRAGTPDATEPADTTNMGAFLERARAAREARANTPPPDAPGVVPTDDIGGAADYPDAETDAFALGDSAFASADSAAADTTPAVSSTQYLATLSPDSLASLVALADSAGREDLAAIYVEIGEVELLDLRRTDEALAAYETVARWFPGSSQEARALLAIAWIRGNRLERAADADSLYWRILAEYGETEFARGAALALGMDVALPELDADSLVAASIAWPAPGAGARAGTDVRDDVREAEAQAAAAAIRDSLTTPPGFEDPMMGLFPGDSINAATRNPDEAQNPMDLLAPRPLTLAEPHYTSEMQDLGLVGKVRVEVMVGLSGNVLDAQVVETENVELNGAAIEAALRSTFTPPRGVDRVTVTFRFPPGDTTAVEQKTGDEY
ncbi:MAG: TonB family protein [bacterium]